MKPSVRATFLLIAAVGTAMPATAAASSPSFMRVAACVKEPYQPCNPAKLKCCSGLNCVCTDPAGAWTCEPIPLVDDDKKTTTPKKLLASNLTPIMTTNVSTNVLDVGGPWPTTGPKTMILGLINKANWSYAVSHKAASVGSFTIDPLPTFPRAGAKLDGNYAWELAADGGHISAQLSFTGAGGGDGALNRNFAMEMVSGPGQFGVSVSHFKQVEVEIANVFQVGNNSDFTAVYTVTVAARRPLSPTCRAAAAKLCGAAAPSGRQQCGRCLAVTQRDALADAGCGLDDIGQLADLEALECPDTPPSAACLAATRKACGSAPRGAAGWLACDNCVDANRASIAAACNGTAATKIVYAFCVDGGGQ